MELLRDLWSEGNNDNSEGDGKGEAGNTGQGIDKGSGDSGDPGDGGGAKKKEKKMTYVQAVSSSSSDEDKGNWTTTTKPYHRKQPDRQKITGAKRPRSPVQGTCGRCFRSSHKTAECRHQVVCMRCAGVGHVAARCPIECSPRCKRLHVRSKIQQGQGQMKEQLAAAQGSQEDNTKKMEVNLKKHDAPLGRLPTRASISLSLSPETEKLREELAKVAVLSIVEGNVNEASVLEVAPTILNRALAGPITPLNDLAILIPLASRQEVKDTYKLGKFRVATRDGPCTLSLSPWSTEIGADGRAVGSGMWTSIWNLPLHGWCWSTIAEVIRPVGDLVALSQAIAKHKYFLSALVRIRLGARLPT
ncbi:Zinc finger CCHC-type protein [Dioscorea alata]|uniref:Zinc finger CCHC-type protein n=1 Tax=Dioscorea alata TaxID=55571 RepID=A0ACB7WS94_DIOAL|nr:Zinc finger CCHC-type protein [Dioscorea alata]